MHLGSPTPADSPTEADTRETTRRRRTIAAALGALTLLVAGTPLLPDSSGPTPGLTPQASESAPVPGPGRTPTRGTITPEMQAEIDRVVTEGERTPVSARASAYRLATASTRCATFDDQRYCLGLGWTTKTQEEAAARLATAATPAPSRTKPERTGDLDPLAAMRRRARLSPEARARAERAELAAAARSVAKVWLIRHEIQGAELPADFAQAHPEARAAVTTSSRDSAATAAASASTSVPGSYPEKFTILKQKQVRPQNNTYYCGPTAMQMIGWGWAGARRGQAHWAQELGTTSAGTAITDMVRVVNESTGYDDAEHAGEYIVLDISDFTFEEWWLLMMKHVHDYAAPVVLHPVLVKQYFPYLDDDASGHFQVGRGFDQNPGGRPKIGYFEPWDQSRFDPTEPRIARTQWQSAYKSYRANQAHFQHNVGV